MIEREVDTLSLLYSITDSYKNIAVSFSGGKDSLVALDLAVRVGIQNAVFIDTTIEFEETKKYVNEIRDYYGIKFDVVKAPRDFFTLAEKIGFPSRRFRWCCDRWKRSNSPFQAAAPSVYPKYKSHRIWIVFGSRFKNAASGYAAPRATL